MTRSLFFVVLLALPGLARAQGDVAPIDPAPAEPSATIEPSVAPPETTDGTSATTEPNETPTSAEPIETTEDDAEVAATEPAVLPPPGSCPRDTTRTLGPTTAPVLDGLLGTPRRACFRTEVALAGDAYLIAEPEAFYGNIRVGGRVSGSVAIGDEVEIWGSFEALRWQSVLSAISTTYLGTGYLTLGGTLRVFDEAQRRVVTWARLVVPTSGLEQHTFPLALEVGSTAEWNAHPNLRMHGALSLMGSVGVSDIGPPLPRGGVRVGGGIDWIPWDALAFQVEVQSSFGYRDGLDYLALSGGVRLAFGDRLAVDLSVLWPFVGAERALLAGQLAVVGRFDDP